MRATHNSLHKRRTDGSTVLDTAAYTYKLYTVDGGVKVLKRRSGQIEKQYRQNAGKLPIAYRSDPYVPTRKERGSIASIVCYNIQTMNATRPFITCWLQRMHCRYSKALSLQGLVLQYHMGARCPIKTAPEMCHQKWSIIWHHGTSRMQVRAGWALPVLAARLSHSAIAT